MENPVSLIRQASTSLGPSWGLLYVEVPAKETFVCRPPEDNILGALHHQLYDFRSLDCAFRAAGMVAIHLERIYEPSGKIFIAGFAVMHDAISVMHSKGKK